MPIPVSLGPGRSSSNANGDDTLDRLVASWAPRNSEPAPCYGDRTCLRDSTGTSTVR